MDILEMNAEKINNFLGSNQVTIGDDLHHGAVDVDPQPSAGHDPRIHPSPTGPAPPGKLAGRRKIPSRDPSSTGRISDRGSFDTPRGSGEVPRRSNSEASSPRKRGATQLPPTSPAQRSRTSASEFGSVPTPPERRIEGTARFRELEERTTNLTNLVQELLQRDKLQKSENDTLQQRVHEESAAAANAQNTVRVSSAGWEKLASEMQQKVYFLRPQPPSLSRRS